MLKKFLIRILLRKRTQENVYFGAKSSLQNDAVSIHLKEFSSEKILYAKALRRNKITVTYSDERREVHEKEVDIKDIDFSKYSITHFYKHWRIDYKNFSQAFFQIYSGYNFVQWFLQNRRDENNFSYYEKHEILKLLIDIKEPVTNQVSFGKLVDEFYGFNIGDRTDHAYAVDLKWKLSALRESKDIQCDDNMLYMSNIEVMPKALNTVSEYYKDSRQHSDIKKLTKAQVVVAFLLLLVTAAQLYFTVTANSA